MSLKQKSISFARVLLYIGLSLAVLIFSSLVAYYGYETLATFSYFKNNLQKLENDLVVAAITGIISFEILYLKFWNIRKDIVVKNLKVETLLGIVCFLLLAFPIYFVNLAFGSLSILGFGNINILAIVGFLILFYFQSFSEEILTKSFLYEKVKANSNIYLAVIIQTLFFGFLHLGNPNMGILPLIGLFTAGVFLNAVYIYTKSLHAVTVTHALWNFTQFAIFNIPVSGNDISRFSIFNSNINTNIWLIDRNFGIEASILIIILELFLSFILLFLHFKNKPQTIS